MHALASSSQGLLASLRASLASSSRALLASLAALRKHPFLSLSCIAADLVFILLLTAFYVPIFMETSDALQKVTAELAASGTEPDLAGTALDESKLLLDESKLLLDESQLLLDGQASAPAALSASGAESYRLILASTGKLLLIIFALLSVTQGFAWWAARKIAGIKTGLDWLWKAPLLVLLWMLSAIVIVLLTQLGMTAFFTAPVPLVSQGTITALSLVLLVIMLHFAASSFARSSGFISSLGAGLKHAKRLVPAFLVTLAGAVFLAGVIPYVAAGNYFIGLLVLLVLLCWLCVGRVWMCFGAKDVIHESGRSH